MKTEEWRNIDAIECFRVSTECDKRKGVWGHSGLLNSMNYPSAILWDQKAECRRTRIQLLISTSEASKVQYAHTFKRAAVPSPPSASGSFLTWANCTPTLLSMILTTVQVHASIAVASCTIHDKVSSSLFWSKETWMQHRNSVQLFLYTVHRSKVIRTNLKPNKLLKSCSETAQQLKTDEHSKHNQI